MLYCKTEWQKAGRFIFLSFCAIYETITQQQQEQVRQFLTEEAVRDWFISQLNDRPIPRLLEEKVRDNPELSVLAASHYVLSWQTRRPNYS